VPRFQDELRESLTTEGAIYKELREKKELSDELEERLQEQLKKFKDTFAVKEDTGLVGAAAE
jgi:F0F1-type ATP synthase alpha subunit